MDACISKLHREWPIPTGGVEDWPDIVGRIIQERPETTDSKSNTNTNTDTNIWRLKSLVRLSRRDQRPPTYDTNRDAFCQRQCVSAPIPILIRGVSHCWQDYLTESKRPPTLVPNPVEAFFCHKQMTQHLLTQFCTSLTVLRIGQFRRNPFSEKLFLKQHFTQIQN